jgi:hypothetical protein
MSAQERLDVKNAHLRTSLLLHAERVAKRASEEQQGAGKPSAQERLLAIRRRVAEKLKLGNAERTSPRTSGDQGNHLGGEGGERGSSPVDKHGYCADGQPEAGGGGVWEEERRRIELLKIHLAKEEGARRIHGPACEARGADGEGERRSSAEAARILDADACGEGVGVASDTANAASRSAWHAVEAADVSR